MEQIALKDFSLTNSLKLFKLFIKMRKTENSNYIKELIKEYYCLENDMPEDFYKLLLNRIRSDDYMTIFSAFTRRNLYLLISCLKYNKEDISGLEEAITPNQYYLVPPRYINKIIEMLKKLKCKDEDNNLSKSIKDEPIWSLKRIPCFNESEYRNIAYKIYLSIGLDNGLELLSNKYGEIDYEQIYFMFSNINIKEGLNENEQQVFNSFLFDNKKDLNNTIRQMLCGKFPELFLNFDYFHNNFSFFLNILGTKLPKGKLKSLLKERYLSRNISTPEITGDISDDMLSSYYCKYEALDTPEQEIYKKNYKIYNEFLRKKYSSSIPMIDSTVKDSLLCEVLKLNDPRNLVLGYRSGNCFRLNGDASILFHNFLQSEHMRLLSVSTPENKDYAMMLIMRNGNVLIGQGIEVSKWAPFNIRGKRLYDACKDVLKKMMEYMNSMGDEIVATIIGSSNSNVSEYNNQVLPFLINPILENPNNFYNGVYNYQCLLDISEGKTLQDIKLYVPSTRYFDEREPILSRTRDLSNEENNYMEIEKRLIALRFFRMQGNNDLAFYQTLLRHNELYTCCNKDWYITLFDDGTIDSFISDENDERAKKEYDSELVKIYKKCKSKGIKTQHTSNPNTE